MATSPTSPVSENMQTSTPVPMQKKILQDVLECIIQMKSDFFDNHQPITDDNVVLQRFCAKFEHLLQIGMKEKTSLLGRKKDYWDYLCECLASAKGSNDGIKYVKSLAENKTSVGRGRAFIRFCLVHQRLADTLQQCVAHYKTIDWFMPSSVLLDPKDCQSLINSLYDLNSLHFDLSPRGYDLDMAWPSFSNRKPGPGGTWTVPISRRSSVTSMCCYSQERRKHVTPAEEMLTQDTVSQISVSVDNVEVDRLAKDLEQAQNAKSDLIFRVEALQQEKEQVCQSAWATHGELQALQQQLAQLQSQHTSLQERYKELDINHMKLKLEKEHAEKYLRDEIKILGEKFKEEESKRVSQLKTEEEIWKQEVREEGERKKREIDRLQKELELNMEEAKKEKVTAAVQEQELKNLMADLGVKSDEAFSDSLVALSQHIKALQLELSSVMSEKLDIQNSLEKQLENNERASILEVRVRELERGLLESEDTRDSLQGKIESYDQVLKAEQNSRDLLEEQNNYLIKELQCNLEEMHKQNIVLKNDLEKKDVNLELSRSDTEEKQRKLNELSEIIENNLSQLKNQEAEIQSLKEEFEKKTEEVLVLKQSSEGQATDLEKLLQKKDEVLTKMKLELDETAKEKEHVSKEAEESRNVNTTLNQKLAAAEMLIGSLNSKYSELEEKMKCLEASLEERNQEVQVKDAIIKEADEEINRLKNELTSVKEELVCSTSQVGKLHADQTTTEVEKEGLKAELKQLQAEKENLKSEMNMEKNRIMGLLQESEGVKRSECEKEEKIASLIIEIEQLRNEKGEAISCLEQKIKSLTDDIRDKNTDISVLKTGIENLKIVLDSEKFSKSEIIDKLESDFQKLNTEKNESELRLKNVIAKLESEAKEVKEIHENETVSYSERIKNLELQLAEKVKVLETKCLDYEDTVERLNKELIISSEKVDIISKMESEVAALAKERDRLLADLNSALEDIEQNKSQQIEIQEQLEKFSTEKISHSSELAVMSEEVTRVMNEHDAFQREMSALKNSLKHAEDEAQEKLTQKRQVELELEDVKSQLDKAQAENVELGIQLDSYQSQTQFSTKVLEENLVEAKDAVELLKMDLMQLQEKCDVAEKERDDLKDRLEKLKEEKQDLFIQLDSLKKNNDNTDGSYPSDASKLKEELQEERLKYLSTIENLNEEISALQFQLSAEQMVQSDAFQNKESGKENNQELKTRVSDMEIIIEQLERELETLHKTKDTDSTQVKSTLLQVQELKKQLNMKHEKCDRLEKDLLQVTARLMEETSRRERLEQDHTHLRRSYDRDVEEKDSEIKNLQSDNEQIKKKLVKLVKDKDTLWHKTDELVTEQKRILGDRWQENARVTYCPQCRTEFSLFVRKHHCRVCGKIFCWSCSDFWIDSPYDDRKIRACKPCFNHGNSLGSALVSTSMIDAESDGEDDDENAEDNVHEDKSTINNRTPRNTDVVPSPQDHASGRRIPWKDDTELNPESLVVYDDLEVDGTDGQAMAGATRSSSDPKEDDISEDSLFQILDQDAVMKSIVAYNHSSPASNMPPNMTSSMVLSADDLKSGEVNRQNEVWIKPGKTFIVPVDIEQKNTVLLWEFTSHPKDIVFSVTYRTNELVAITEAEVIVAPCKCDSHKQTVRGELTAKLAGIYTLVFDNTYSKMISKKVHYSLEYRQH